MMSEHITHETLNLCRKMQGKSLLEMLVFINNEPLLSLSENKKLALDMLNGECDTNYNVNHFNNWLSGRKPTPQNVKSVARRCVMQFLFGDDVATMLTNIY